MATSTLKYADQDDLRRVFPDYGKYIPKVRLYGWTEVSNVWSISGAGYLLEDPESNPSTALILFNGLEGTWSPTSPNVEGKYSYTAGTDTITIFTTTDPNDDQRVELAEDKTVFIDQQLINAAQELDGMMDGRFSRPLQKNYLDNAAGIDPEYDYSIIRVNCLLCAKNLLIAAREYDEAERIYSQVTNIEGTGIVDRINSGKDKLSFEIEASSSQGEILQINWTDHKLKLVQVYGQWSGIPYEVIKVKVTSAGAIGAGEFTVYTSNSEGLFQAESGPYIITGALQEIGGGLRVRFAGADAEESALNDEWRIHVYNYAMKETNAGIKSVNLWR